MKIISSPHNDIIKQYKKLCSSKKERDRSGLFVLEGVRLVTDCTVPPEQLLFTEAAKERYADRLTDGFITGCKSAAVISDDVARTIAETENSQGVFAVCRKPSPRSVSEYGGEPLLILDNLQDPGNMGTIMRTAEAFGVSLCLCGCCDEFSPKAVRSAMGAAMRVTVYHDTFENAVSLLKAKNKSVAAAVLSDNAEILGTIPLDSTVIVIGNEGSGIPEEHTALCDKSIIIPMSGGAESLNAAMAAGIFIWELSKKS